MPWNNVKRKAADDCLLTDKQKRLIISLQEQIDRAPQGAYSSNHYALTSREADRYIQELQRRLDARKRL